MKNLLIIVVFGTFFTASQAQVKFGAKAGLNLATFAGDDADDANSKIGVNVGGFAEIPVTETFSARPELVFSTQGAKADIAGSDFKVNLSYINIPVLGKYNASSGFFAETGPQIGFLVAAKAKVGGESVDVKDAYKSTDFAWAFGLGYEMAELGFGINLRYNLGLSSIDDGDAKIKNSVFQLGVFKTLGGGTSVRMK